MNHLHTEIYVGGWNIKKMSHGIISREMMGWSIKNIMEWTSISKDIIKP